MTRVDVVVDSGVTPTATTACIDLSARVFAGVCVLCVCDVSVYTCFVSGENALGRKAVI